MNKKVTMHIKEANTQKDRATASTYFCSASKCPLLESNKCIHLGLFQSCIYGSVKTQRTSTKRAKSYDKELTDLRKEQSSLPNIKTCYDKCITLIDEYYYLPYAHMTMCENVPFLQHSNILTAGKPFIHKDDFNAKSIVTLVNFNPRSLMGGIITAYQSKIIPSFLLHLQILYPALYNEACELDPGVKNKTLDCSSINKIETRLTNIRSNDAVSCYKVVYLKTVWDVVSYSNDNLTVSTKKSPFIMGPKGDSYTITIHNPVEDSISVIVSDPYLIQQIILRDPSCIPSR